MSSDIIALCVCMRQELQQKRAQRAEEVQRIAEQEVDGLQKAGKVGRKKPAQSLPTSPIAAKAKNTGIRSSAGVVLFMS